MAYHFWNSRVYSMYGHNRTNFCFLEIQVLIWQGHDISHCTIASVKHFYLTDGYCPTCKNVQKASYTQKTYNNTILLWYVYHPGVFTFSETAVFSPGWGCVQLTRQLQNCIKFSHNSPNHTKFTSIVTSIKYWKSKQK